MNKKLLQTALVFLSSLIMIACSTTPSANMDARSMDYVHFSHSMPLKKVNKLIKEAGEEAGWRMTEFKESALIAEKIGDDSEEAVTINFSNNSFHLTPANSDLQDAIEDKLNSNNDE